MWTTVLLCNSCNHNSSNNENGLFSASTGGVSAYSNPTLPSQQRALTSLTAQQQQTRHTPLTTSALPMALSPSSCDEDCDVESFELHVGRALDTLRRDYPQILTQNPDFSIYDPTIEFVDPSGVKVHGLRQYKGAFSVLHALIQVIYCPARSSLSLRMCYDKARQNIRVSWNVEAVPREIFGGLRTTAHVDGISVYELDRDNGNITQHRIERLIYNDREVRPKEGVIDRLRKEHAVTVPSFNHNNQYPNVGVLEFRKPTKRGAASPLFALEATGWRSGEQR